MSRLARHILITALAFAPAWAPACASAQAGQVQGGQVQSGKVQTTDEANRESVQGAVQAPLRDLNVVRTKIPAVLQQAMSDPYKRPPIPPKAPKKAQCTQLVQLIKPLNDALGADLDAPVQDQDGLLDKGRETALGAAASFASDAIPFHGWVRKLSGAERHDRLVQAAITAGAVRRAYLKGLGEAHGCDPPATPSHVLTEVAKTPPRSRFKPLYPTR
jgi:hypothetical protein